MPAQHAAPTFPSRSQVLSAVAGGLATTAYYATPDVIAGRRARGWAKAGLAVAALAATVPAIRAELADRRQALGEPVRTHSEGAPTDGQELSGRGKAVAALVGGTLVLGTVASTVAAERWIFRRGQARAAAGKSLPHTGPALLYGALSAALALVPLPEPEGARTASR